MKGDDLMVKPPDELWRKASASAAEGECVEVTQRRVRDSKNPGGGLLAADLGALVAVVKTGRLDNG